MSMTESYWKYIKDTPHTILLDGHEAYVNPDGNIVTAEQDEVLFKQNIQSIARVSSGVFKVFRKDGTKSTVKVLELISDNFSE